MPQSHPSSTLLGFRLAAFWLTLTATLVPFTAHAQFNTCQVNSPGNIVECSGGNRWCGGACVKPPLASATTECANSAAFSCTTCDCSVAGPSCTTPSTIGSACVTAPNATPTITSGGIWNDNCSVSCVCPTGSSIVGTVCKPIVLLSPGTPDTGSLSVTGNVTAGGNLTLSNSSSGNGDIYIPNGKAFHVDGAGTTTMNYGNWGSGNTVYLGINSNTPVYLLDARANSSANGAILSVDDNKGDLWTGLRLARFASEKWFVGIKPTNEDLAFQYSGTTTAMTIKNDGNVGIGASNPTQAKLVVNGGVGILGSNTMKFAADLNNPPYIKGRWLDNNYTGLEFHTFSNAVDLTSLVINESGNVGIGNINPAAKLHVTGGKVYIDPSSFGGSPDISMAVGDTDTGLDSTADGTLNLVANNESIMSIRPFNVGIGTINPDAAAKLDVAGQIKITGGSPGLNKVLTSDANGLATWATPVTGSTISGTAGRLTKFATANTLGDSAIYDNGTNIGIGIAPSIFKGLNLLESAGIYGLYSEATSGDGVYGKGSGTGVNGQGSTGVNGDGTNIGVAGTGTNTGVYGSGPTGVRASGQSSGLWASSGQAGGTAIKSVASGTAYAGTFMGGNVGIGTATPGALLEVAGQIKVTGGSPSAGRVLTSDASGLASWADPTISTPTFSGLVTGNAGLTITGAAVNLNSSSNFPVNIATGSSTGAVSIGGNSNTLAINTSTWDVSSAGAISGLTGIVSSGNITATGSGTITSAGLLSSNGGLTVTGGQINLNASASSIYGVNIATGAGSTGSVYVGSNGNNIVIQSVNWRVSSAGVLSGLTGLTSTGVIDLTGGVLSGGSPLVFEGATADAFETTFAVADPTADRTITFPNKTGTVALTSDISAATTTLQQAYDNDADGAGVTLTTNATDGEIVIAGNQQLQVTTTANSVFDTNTLVVDALNNRVGIGTAVPGYALDVNGDAKMAGRITASGDQTGNTPIGLVASVAMDSSDTSGIGADFTVSGAVGNTSYQARGLNVTNTATGGISNTTGKIGIDVSVSGTWGGSNAGVQILNMTNTDSTGNASHDGLYVTNMGVSTGNGGNRGAFIGNYTTNTTRDQRVKMGLEVISVGNYPGLGGTGGQRTTNYGLYVSEARGADDNYTAWLGGTTVIGKNPLYFTSAWSSAPDAVTDTAEISNDTSAYQTLMIVGNKSAGGSRSVSVWDKLTINGDKTLYFDYTKEALRGDDTWLRLNPSSGFTSGIYTPGFLSANSLSVGTSAASGVGNLDVANVADLQSTGVDADGKIALRVAGSEALWFNGNRFSWGYGGTENYFADKITTDDSITVAGSSWLNYVWVANQLDIYNSDSTGVVSEMHNASKGSDADGIMIYAGPDTNPGPNNDFIQFMDGNGTLLDSIQGDSAGGVNFTGNASGTYSDRRLKKNIMTYSGDALAQIEAFHTVTFNYKLGTNPGLSRVGFIAQEMLDKYPQAINFGDPLPNVPESELPILSFDYGELTPLLTEGVKELNAKVESQATFIKSLEARLKKLESSAK